MTDPDTHTSTPETGWRIVLKLIAFIAVPTALIYLVKLFME